MFGVPFVVHEDEDRLRFAFVTKRRAFLSLVHPRRDIKIFAQVVAAGEGENDESCLCRGTTILEDFARFRFRSWKSSRFRLRIERNLSFVPSRLLSNRLSRFSKKLENFSSRTLVNARVCVAFFFFFTRCILDAIYKTTQGRQWLPSPSPLVNSNWSSSFFDQGQ